MQNKKCYCADGSIEAAVKGTPFRYSTWQEYLDIGDDMVKFFDLYTKYPCIEYLTKLGFSNLVKGKLLGNKTYSTINWRGQTIEKVLRLPKHEIKYLKHRSSRISFYTLHLYHFCKRHGMPLQVDEIVDFEEMVPEYNLDPLNELMNYTTIRKIYNYVHKQCANNNDHPFLVLSNTLRIWIDYLHDCKHLNMTITDRVLFPKNLRRAHQNTIKRIKYLENQKLNKLIESRLVKLKKYQYENDGLFIRPIKDTKELIDEGNVLNHCVGGYAENYANGHTNLFVVRKTHEPDKPYYTVEIIDKSITQAYGLKNSLPTDEVQEFLDTFENIKLKKKSPRNKESQTIAV